VHAHSHLRALDGVKGTEENLKEAIAGEAHEFKDMYPDFLSAAQQEGNKRAEISFRNALAVEKVHHDLYAQALQAVQSGKDLTESDIHVCSICGHTIMGESPDRCPVCKAPGERFFKVK
jgi:rubrerythrin